LRRGIVVCASGCGDHAGAQRQGQSGKARTAHFLVHENAHVIFLLKAVSDDVRFRRFVVHVCPLCGIVKHKIVGRG